MVTIRDVAVRAGVSVTTVSHVINQSRPVSAELRERVLAAMTELGFQPNAVARSLRSRQTHTFGMILPDSANPFFAEVARGIEDASFAFGYSVIVCNSDGDPARELRYINLLAQKRVDGLLLVAAGECAQRTALLKACAIPAVIIDRELPDLTADCVLIDNAEGGRLAIEHLLALGHRRIGCIAGPAALSPGLDRLAGYRQALHAARLAPDDALIVNGDFHDRGGYAAAQALLSLPDPPTAIFAGNDLMALGAMAAAHAAGVQIPAELSIVGFDDIHLAAFLNPPLTTVAQPKHELGVLAAEMLFARLEQPALPARRRLLSTQLVVRGSTAPCPQLQAAAQSVA